MENLTDKSLACGVHHMKESKAFQTHFSIFLSFAEEDSKAFQTHFSIFYHFAEESVK